MKIQTDNQMEFVKLLNDISKLPKAQADEAMAFIHNLLLCLLHCGDDFVREIKALFDKGDIDACKKLVEMRAGH